MNHAGALPSTEVEATAAGRNHPTAHATESGIYLAAAAAPIGLAQTAPETFEYGRWLHWSAVAVAMLLLAAALTTTRHPLLGRVLSTLAIVCTLALGVPQLAFSPLSTLSALVAATTALLLLWRIGAPVSEEQRVRRRPLREGQAQGAAMVAVVLWLFWTLTDLRHTLVSTLTVGWAVLCGALLGLDWAVHNFAKHRVRSVTILAPFAVAACLVPTLWGDWWWLTSAFVGPAVLTAAVVRRSRELELERTSWWEPLLGHPERLFVGTFAALCFGGTVLLALPQSSTTGESIGLIDAAFTATSAVCVTGLIVLDTPVDFSAFGQVVLLLLFQIGGLGIMTFSTAALWALGRRMSLRHEGAVANLISPQARGRLFSTAKQILQLTLVVEGVGALLLAVAFVGHGDRPALALWRGLFTSISAFCNAGFALQSDSLIPYQNSPLVLHVVGAVIVIGGLSPLATLAVPAVLSRSSVPVSAQARLALSAAGVLLAAGFLFFLAFEWNDSLGGLGTVDKLHNAWFQSVTLRTAGFNSVDLTRVRSATLIPMLLWMFIGGSPGGTAGGVKTTTVAVLALSVLQAIRGQWTLEAFGKRIPERTRSKAAVVVFVAGATGLAALVAILLTQNMSGREAVFEVVSALGTVGLSIGGTAALDGIGKAIIILCMFIGRVGGLTLLMFLSSRHTPPTLGRPEEEIDVG